MNTDCSTLRLVPYFIVHFRCVTTLKGRNQNRTNKRDLERRTVHRFHIYKDQEPHHKTPSTAPLPRTSKVNGKLLALAARYWLSRSSLTSSKSVDHSTSQWLQSCTVICGTRSPVGSLLTPLSWLFCGMFSSPAAAAPETHHFFQLKQSFQNRADNVLGK